MAVFFWRKLTSELFMEVIKKHSSFNKTLCSVYFGWHSAEAAAHIGVNWTINHMRMRTWW
jgi:hypothetical protein